MYLDPPQQQYQKGEQGGYVIKQLLEFCASPVSLKKSEGTDSQENESSADSDEVDPDDAFDRSSSLRPYEGQRTFGEFLCFFHICKKSGNQELSVADIEENFNRKMRFSVKKRCIV